MDEDEQSFNKVYKKTVQTKDPCNSNNLFGQTKIALFEQMKEFVKNRGYLVLIVRIELIPSMGNPQKTQIVTKYP